MVGIEPHLPIVRLDENDAADGLALSIEAHWNQNERDWRFLLTKGVVFGVRDRDRRLIATAALLPYTEREAWISMVLVTASCRRGGLATRLIEACLDTAMKLRLTTWLDATPAGVAVYGPLGFIPTIQLRRLRIQTTVDANAGMVLPQGKLSEFIIRDISAMGFDRRDLLGELSGRPASQLVSTGDAMVLVRDGRTGRHIGPLFADDPKRAIALVNAIIAGEPGPHLIDAVATQDAFIKGLTDAGWTVERPFQR
ncbi:MAG: GNAT family N-acetyltransferase, partial [Bradyrhizobium sp.]|nr:GNAT family N-acetyltransferase [Bradyrhizobium sp.]